MENWLAIWQNLGFNLNLGSPFISGQVIYLLSSSVSLAAKCRW